MFTLFPVWVQSIAISMSVYVFVCLSLCSHISKATPPNVTLLYMLPVVVARLSSDGSATILCGNQQTYGFADDVMLSCSGANGPESKTFRSVYQVVAPGEVCGLRMHLVLALAWHVLLGLILGLGLIHYWYPAH